MRSNVLIIAAATLSLIGCPSDDDEPSTTSTTEQDPTTTGQTTTTDEGGSSSSDGGSTSTGEADGSTSTGEADGTSTGEMQSVCPYEDPGWQEYAPGVQIPHWELETHDGEIFRACDYYGGPMFLDISAMWCQPCQAMAAYLAGNDEAADYFWGGDPQYLHDYVYPFRDYVNAGCIKWVTVIDQNEQGMPPSNFDAQVWDTQYHNPNIPVIADPTGDFSYWTNLTAFPTTILINGDFTYITNDFTNGLELVVDNLECDVSGR